MKALIVEDDATCRLLLVQLLSEYGAVSAVDNGESALELIEGSLKEHQLFDLICLDIVLPGMDGQQILGLIRNAEERAGFPVGLGSKILMTTSLRDKDSILTAFRSLCDGYLRKPFTKADLQEQLRTLTLIA